MMIDAEFDTKYEHYDSVSARESLTTVWSIFEVKDLYAPHPFVGAESIVYKDHWGGKTVSCKIADNSNRTDRWIDLYKAANYCIRNSGDNHHIYIEEFRRSIVNPTELYLQTGS